MSRWGVLIFLGGLVACSPQDISMRLRSAESGTVSSTEPFLPSHFDLVHFGVQRLMHTKRALDRALSGSLQQADCQQVEKKNEQTILVKWDRCSTERKGRQVMGSGEENVTWSADEKDLLITSVHFQTQVQGDAAYEASFDETRTLRAHNEGSHWSVVDEIVIPYRVRAGEHEDLSTLKVRVQGIWYADEQRQSVRSLTHLAIELRLTDTAELDQYTQTLFLMAEQLDMSHPCGWPAGAMEGLSYINGQVGMQTTKVDVDTRSLRDSLTGKSLFSVPKAPACQAYILPDYAFLARF